MAGRHWQTGEAETDAAGNFRIHNVTPNRDFYLEVSHPKFTHCLSPTSLRAQPGEAVRASALTLSRGVAISGKVLDAAGNPVPDAKVRLLATRLRSQVPAGFRPISLARETHRSIETDANGGFTFEGLADGRRKLIVRHPQFAAYEQELDVDRSVTATVGLEIRLQPK